MVNDADLFEITALIYNRWTMEYDSLKAVKAETDDGEPDWAAFHEHRLKQAMASEAKWKGILNRFKVNVKPII